MNFEFNIDTTSSYFDEMIDVSLNYKYILKNPKNKLPNIKNFIILILAWIFLCCVSIGINLIKVKAIFSIIILLLLVCPYFIYMYRYYKQIKFIKSIKHTRHSKLSFTNKKISETLIINNGSKKIQQLTWVDWNDVQFIRIFDKSIVIFLSDDNIKPFIFIKKEYEEQLEKFISDNDINIKIVKDEEIHHD